VNTSTSTNTNTNNNNNNTTYTGTSTNTNNNNNNNTTNYTGNTTSNNTNTNNNTNNTTINSTSNNTNTNNNNSNINQNVNSTSNNTNTNNNNNNTTSNNTNNNYNESKSDSNVTTNNTNTNTNNNKNENRNYNETTQKIEQEIKSPPPSAIAPSIGASFSQDLCTTGVSGAVQTQLFGVAAGKSVTDKNCERIKLSKTVYDMGMKVAAVSLMCQDKRVFAAMEMAGTPCPYMGKIGQEAAAAWEVNPQERPDYKEYTERLDNQAVRQTQLDKLEDAIENDKKVKFVSACKKTRHLSGEYKGVKKSGRTCRIEWKQLQKSEQVIEALEE